MNRDANPASATLRRAGMALCMALAWGCTSASSSTENGLGAGGSGGMPATGDGGTAPACVPGTVSFQLAAAAGDSFFVQQAYPECPGANWLKVFDLGGTEQGLIFPGASLACDSCSKTTWSEICTTTTAAPVDAASWTWDGHRYGPGTCGGATCIQQECAPAGQYYVTMCGSATTAPDSTHRCVQTSFNYPAAGPVTATLPALTVD